MDKHVRYVHAVNPITGQPCTVRIVVTADDVTLWQADQVFDSEEAFDLLDTEDLGMVSMPHDSFREVMKAYLLLTGEAVYVGTTTLEEDEAEQDELTAQGIADQEAEAKARAEYEHDEEERHRHMESDEHEEEKA